MRSFKPGMHAVKKPSISRLFLAFLKLGLTAFGGPAMVSHIKSLSVNKKQWVDEESFKIGIALCQTIPGAIAVNVASYVGFRTRGLPGMLASFAGFSLPAFLLMLIFSAVYAKTRSLPAITSLFNGLEVIVIAIIAHATYSFGKNILKTKKDMLIAVAGACALALNVNPFVVIAGAGLAGILLYDIHGIKTHSAKPGIYQPFKSAFILSSILLTGMASLFILDKKLFDLAFVMSKIELFAFGGGYTALTLMSHEIVDSRLWLDSKAFMDGVALGQVTPGPILITATFIGYLLKGIPGSVVGSIAIFAPGLLLITITLPFFDRLSSSAIFARLLKGIVCCFVGLLLFITIKFGAGVSWDTKRALLCSASSIAIFSGLDILYVVITGAIISVFIF